MGKITTFSLLHTPLCVERFSTKDGQLFTHEPSLGALYGVHERNNRRSCIATAVRYGAVEPYRGFVV